MNTSVCIVISMMTLAMFVIIAIDNRHNASKWIGFVLLGILLSSFPLFLPYCYADALQEVDYLHRLRALSMTVYNSLKAVGGGQEIKNLEDISYLTFESDAYRTIYLTLNYLYLVTGPILTSGFLISLVGDTLDRMRYHIRMYSNYHVFSHLNENSLQIAKSLRKKSTIVFCGTKNTDKVLIAQARQCGALLLHGSCESVALPFELFKHKKTQFYLINPDEDRNLANAEQLIKMHREKKNRKIAINAFAESGTGIEVVESMDKGNLAVRFIDMTALLCNHLLMQFPLYDLPEKQKDISVMIVGCDKTGMRMLKTVCWCGIVDGYKLKIRVYDRNANVIKEKFRIQCPEEMEKCDISFVEVDAETAAFGEAVLDEQKGSCDATYIIMAMGDDEKNIAIADRLFRLFRHQNKYGWTPQILVRIRSGTKSGVYLDRDNGYLEKRKIHLFGSLDDIYGENTLFYSNLERLAFAVDLCYNNKLPKKNPADMKMRDLRKYLSSKEIRDVRSRFTQSEYNRRSSMATALHIASKLHSCGVLAKCENELTDEKAAIFEEKIKDEQLILTLAQNEHLRWNNFMRSEGYCRAEKEEFRIFYPQVESSKDKLSKRHICLVKWSDLQQVTDMFNELDWPIRKAKNPELEDKDKTDYIKNDMDIVEKIPVIITLTNILKKTGLDEKLYL